MGTERSKVRQVAAADALIANAVRLRPDDTNVVLAEIGYTKHTALQKSSEMQAQAIVMERRKEGEESIKNACTDEGLTPRHIASRIKMLTEHDDYRAVTSGIDIALKVGVGGGYAAQKTESVALHVAGSVDDFAKHRALNDEYDARLRADALADQEKHAST
jgi:hypothetical protein